MKTLNPSPFLKPVLIITAAFLSLAPIARGERDIIFSENFEGCDIGEYIGKTKSTQWHSSDSVRGESQGLGIAVKGKGANRSTIAITTPETTDGNGGTTYNLSSYFPETSGTLRIELDVFPEHGNGQIIVRPRSKDPGAALAQIQFQGGRDAIIRAYSADNQGGKAAIPIGKFRFNQWYKVLLTLHLDKASPTYDVEITEAGTRKKNIKVAALKCPTAARAAGNIVIGSISDKKSRYGWDNITVERLRAGKQ